MEAAFVALTNSCGELWENAPSQSLEKVTFSIIILTILLITIPIIFLIIDLAIFLIIIKRLWKPHCDGDQLFELYRLLLKLCRRFLQKVSKPKVFQAKCFQKFSNQITNHPVHNSKLDLVDKLADTGELFQPIVVKANLRASGVQRGNFGKTAEKNPKNGIQMHVALRIVVHCWQYATDVVPDMPQTCPRHARMMPQTCSRWCPRLNSPTEQSCYRQLLWRWNQSHFEGVRLRGGRQPQCLVMIIRRGVGKS